MTMKSLFTFPLVDKIGAAIVVALVAYRLVDYFAP